MSTAAVASTEVAILRTIVPGAMGPGAVSKVSTHLNVFAPQAHFPGCAQPRLLECPVYVTFACVSGDFMRRTALYDFAKNETTS